MKNFTKKIKLLLLVQFLVSISAFAQLTPKEMVEKMEGFAGAIAHVNEIKLHHSIVDGNVSASEFTFDFDMKDGSKILWHEIIRRIWNDEGKITNEEYFNAQ